MIRFVATFGCPGELHVQVRFWERKTGRVQFHRHLRSGGGGWVVIRFVALFGRLASVTSAE